MVKAAYSLARDLAVREKRADKAAQAAVGEVERSARNVERLVGYLDDKVAAMRKEREALDGRTPRREGLPTPRDAYASPAGRSTRRRDR